ncbi:MAG: ATP-binding cassette domain-containing protein, partial [Shewanella sp.]
TGLVMQDPEVQLLRQTVGAEVAFALENLGISSEHMLPKVQTALRRVGLYLRLDTPVSTLSLGQKYRLMLAAQLVCEPQLLLLDEPWAQLDDQGVDELLKVLRQLLEEGVALVLVEHHFAAFNELIQHHWQLDAGRLSKGYYQDDEPQERVNLAKPANWAPDRQGPEELDRQAPRALGPALIQADAFELGFEGAQRLFHCPDGFTLRAGEIATLVGDNGSGKTSLLKTLAGLQGHKRLPLNVLGRRPKLGIYGPELGLLMQRPSRQLFETTVLAEMQFSLKRFALPLERAEQMLAALDLLSLAPRSPHQLSYGQQHLVALASLVCLRPKVLLLDDPFAGMDRHYAAKVWQVLRTLSRDGGAILLSSHRELEHGAVSQRWRLRHGRLLQAPCSRGDGDEH